MALMYPTSLPDDVASAAERRLFRLFQAQLPDDFVVLHSVEWLVRERRFDRDGEADFLIVHPDLGILVLEVKGGGVRVDDQSGTWSTVDRHGEEHVLKRSPFDQAKHNAYALRDKLEEMPATRPFEYRVEYGVALPDVTVGSDGIGAYGHREKIIDSTDLPALEAAVRRVMGPPGEVSPLPKAAVDAVVDAFKPVREIVRRGLNAETLEAEEQIIRLTEQQYRVLDGLRLNTRALISGCAGSGKTMLALEKARRLAREGSRVLFTCFNRALAEWIREQLRGEPPEVSGNVEVHHYHSLAYRWCDRAGVQIPPVPDDGTQHHFSKVVPEKFLEAIERTEERFDAVIVDEGQDFKTDWFVTLLYLLRDEDRGVYYIFYDDNQRIYTQEAVFPFDGVRYSLSVNCRNTQRIHEAVIRYYRGALPPTVQGPEGREIELVDARGGRPLNGLSRALHRLVTEERVPRNHIVVLTPNSEAKSALKEGARVGTVELTWKPNPGPNQVRVATIYSFKGLESPIVVVAELDRLAARGTYDAVLYVALSRARSHVVVVGELPEPAADTPAPPVTALSAGESDHKPGNDDIASDALASEADVTDGEDETVDVGGDVSDVRAEVSTAEAAVETEAGGDGEVEPEGASPECAGEEPDPESTGYTQARHRSRLVADALRELAVLIGEPGDEPVVLPGGATVQPGLGFARDAEALLVRARDLDLGLFKVLVLGEFKNGKSTLLNAMLGSPALPAKAAPATAIITALVHGENEGVRVYEVGQDTPRVLSREEFLREFQLTPADQQALDAHEPIDRFQHIRYAEMETLHPLCANGVMLIDSPGLGEHASRTRVATDFLKQVQAVVFVLNAKRILSLDEREFIEHALGPGRLTHVFFVVNYVNQLDEPSDVEDIKEFVRLALGRHFLDEDGAFDADLYDRRVFFIDARGALRARSQDPVDTTALEASGVPAFERELERFLTSDEKLQAALQSPLPMLRHIAARVERKVADDCAALDQPVEELERRHQAALESLRQLDLQRQEIERTVRLHGESISRAVYANLQEYVSELRSTWPQDSERFIKLEELTLLASVESLWRDQTKERIASSIEAELKHYLHTKLARWQEQVSVVIEPDIARLAADVDAEIAAFNVRLDEIAEAFSVGHARRTIAEEVEGDRTRKLLQAAAGGIMLDPSQVHGALFGKADWTGFFRRVVEQVVLASALPWILPGGPLLWAAYIAIEASLIRYHANRVRKQLRSALGEKLFEQLAQDLPARRDEIEAALRAQFDVAATVVTRALQAEIDEVRNEQQRIIVRMREASFSAEQEKARLRAIGQRVDVLVDTVLDAATGAQEDPREVVAAGVGKRLGAAGAKTGLTVADE